MTKTRRKSSIPKKPDLGICAHANLRKATRVVSQIYESALRPTGLRATQFTLLAVLNGRGPMALTKLAEILVMDRTTLSRNLKPLVTKNWLEIGREDDERVRLLSITPKGRKIVANAIPLWREAQGQITKAIGDRRLVALISDLNDLVEAVRVD